MAPLAPTRACERSAPLALLRRQPLVADDPARQGITQLGTSRIGPQQRIDRMATGLGIELCEVLHEGVACPIVLEVRQPANGTGLQFGVHAG